MLACIASTFQFNIFIFRPEYIFNFTCICCLFVCVYVSLFFVQMSSAYGLSLISTKLCYFLLYYQVEDLTANRDILNKYTMSLFLEI